MTTSHNPQASQATEAAPLLVGPASFQLDPGASSVSISHKTIWGLVTVRGQFQQLNGDAEIRADGSARGRLEIGAASLNTKNRKRDEHLRSADFFNATEHPQIVVDLSQASLRGEDSVAAEGTLTVAGKTRPLALTADLAEASDQGLTLRAETQIDRADFGLKWNQLGMIKGAAQVSVVARFVKTTAA
jgi:polyisoprenoid-binding protein YceI